MTLGFNEAVKVIGTPTLKLNDGGTAIYVGGSGTSSLTFRTTVASNNTNTSALAITGVNLANGASIHDASGAAANLAGAVKTFSGLQVATSSSSTSSGTSSSSPSTQSSPSASQTITVTDPRPATGTTTTSPHTTTVTNPAPASDATTASPQTISLTNPAPETDTTTAFPGGKGFAWLNQDQAASTVATTEPQAIAATIGSLANHGFTLLQQHLDGVTGAAPISVPQTIAETDSAPATGKAMASLASQSFALLNQYMAGNTGRVDRGQIVAAVSNGTGWGQDSILTRPQH